MTTPMTPSSLQETRINYHFALPKHLFDQTPLVILQQPTPLSTIDSIQSLRTTVEPHCCKGLLDLLASPFNRAWEMISRLFGVQAQIDPLMQAKWDLVVEKNYDLPTEPNPYYRADVNECRRGKTIADDLVKAMARTQISPPFKHVLIYEIYNAGCLFSEDGFYGRLASQARQGKFNNPDTLIIFALKNGTVDEQAYIRAKIEYTRREGHPIDNAKFAVLTPSESGDVLDQRIPNKLMTLFQQP